MVSQQCSRWFITEIRAAVSVITPSDTAWTLHPKPIPTRRDCISSSRIQTHVCGMWKGARCRSRLDLRRPRTCDVSVHIAKSMNQHTYTNHRMLAPTPDYTMAIIRTSGRVPYPKSLSPDFDSLTCRSDPKLWSTLSRVCAGSIDK